MFFLLNFHKTSLFHKLYHYGIHDALLLWLKSFLTNRSQYVISDNQESSNFSVVRGTSRHSFSPVALFLLYINDLPSCVCSKVKLMFYFIHKICSETDFHVLQQDLDALAHWACIWQMEFNSKKCEFIRIINLLFNPITLSLFLLAKFHTQNILV